MIMIEGPVTRTDFSLQLPIEPITSGCKNSIFLHLSFSKFWREYTERTVEFRTLYGERHRARVSRAGICVLPEAALMRSGRIFLSVVGEKLDADGTVAARAVTELVSLRVFRGGYDEREEASG